MGTFCKTWTQDSVLLFLCEIFVIDVVLLDGESSIYMACIGCGRI